MTKKSRFSLTMRLLAIALVTLLIGGEVAIWGAPYVNVFMSIGAAFPLVIAMYAALDVMRNKRKKTANGTNLELAAIVIFVILSLVLMWFVVVPQAASSGFVAFSSYNIPGGSSEDQGVTEGSDDSGQPAAGLI